MHRNWAELDRNITDPAFYAGSQRYHDEFARLRAEDPVHWTTSDTFARPFWSVTTHKLCREVLVDSPVFSARDGSFLRPGGVDLTPEQIRKGGIDALITNLDPPGHDVLRQPFNRYFSMPAAKRSRDMIAAIVDDLVEGFAPKGSCDVVEDYSAQITVNFFLTLMDIPQGDWPLVRAICTTMLQPFDPESARGRQPADVFIDAFGALYEYLRADFAKRRANLGTDLSGTIVSTEVGGEPLDERAAAWLGVSILGGGLETTRNSIALGLLELLRRPDQAALVREEPAMMKSAIEEIIRYTAPSKNRLRVALEDTTLGGTKIAAGDWVVPWLVSANRDSTVFDDPHTFDVRRTVNPHLSFGEGVHHCLGRHFARVAMDIGIGHFLRRFPDATVADEVVWVPSHNITGLKRFPVTFAPTAG